MIDLIEPDHPLDELLEDARMAASSDWEEEFVDSQLQARKCYGQNWYPTDRQIDKLKQIVGKKWLEDGYDR